MASNWNGRTLGGRYQIKELLGQGGMSAVYKAYDPNLRRTVAIKLIHPHLSCNPDFVRRFEEEATGVAHLRHPNIVQVYDFSHEDDLYYMVMEYLLGETLQARLKRLNAAGRRLAMKDALKYTIDVCNAAEYAHQRGTIHRDIKPANIMIDVHNTAILMDFGIARMVGGQQHTATGAVLGTALYMSPEQIQGLQPDPRADVYSLGVALFEMLNGRPPYEADSAMTLMMMHLHDPLPDLYQLNPHVSPELVAVVNKALAKNREQRYPGAVALATDLTAVLNSLPDSETAQAIPVAAPSAAPHSAATVIEGAIAATPTPAPAPVSSVAASTLVEPAIPATVPGISGTPDASSTPPGYESTFIEPALSATPSPSRPIPARTTPAGVELAGGAQPPAGPPAGAAVYPAAQPVPPEQARRVKHLGIRNLVILLLLGAAGVVYLLFFRSAPNGNAPNLTQPAAIVMDTEMPAIIALATATQTLAAEPTLEPSATPEPELTATPEPSATSEPSATPAPLLPALGGADQIAFFSGGDIWTANIDGSALTQLTTDGAAKTYLRWLPDGQGLTYISGKCIQSVSLAGVVETISCFNSAEYLESFEVSPDGQRVALSLDHQLYLLPFDLPALSGANSHGDLAGMATCPDLAPYRRNSARYARWSADGTHLAVVVLGVLKDGRRGDLVQVFAVDQCIPNPLISVQFPEPHFSYRDYEKVPTLQDLAWDGSDLFIMHSHTRNEGFGDLHIFNTETFRFSQAVNPVRGVCCYRDPQFSPDGSHLLFAFQDYGAGSSSVTQLYYIPYGSLGTGATYQPLPLPEISDPREQPQPVLRPAAP
jgi:serine/threonine protein kinase